MKEIQLDTGLTPSQLKADEALYNSGQNLFITGQAGTGKSFVLNRFRRTHGTDYKVIASTGAAAVLVGGSTFHSFFGLGLMQGRRKDIIQKALDNNKVVMRIGPAKGIILDEISMIPAAALDIANEICQIVRDDTRPWGGIRVIAVGDFFQLPPIAMADGKKDWAFFSKTWADSDFKTVCLEEVVRCEDSAYLEILSKIRKNRVDESVRTFMNSKVVDINKGKMNFGERPFLHSRRNVVDAFNRQCLDQIPAPLHTSQTTYIGHPHAIESLKKNMPISDVVELKVGAFVMTRVNDVAKRFVNGSVGHVEEIRRGLVVVRMSDGDKVGIEQHEFNLYDPDGKVLATATNYPLCLAYAITIHKSQGTTLDSMMVDLRNLWEPGQAYVALSRLRNPDDLQIVGWDEGSIRTDPYVVNFYNGL